MIEVDIVYLCEKLDLLFDCVLCLFCAFYC